MFWCFKLYLRKRDYQVFLVELPHGHDEDGQKCERGAIFQHQNEEGVVMCVFFLCSLENLAE